MSKPQRVAVVGVGYSTVGRRTGLSLEKLTAQAVGGGHGRRRPHGQGHRRRGRTQLPPPVRGGHPDRRPARHPRPVASYSGSVDGAAYSVAAIARHRRGGVRVVPHLPHRPDRAPGRRRRRDIAGQAAEGAVRRTAVPAARTAAFTGSHWAGMYMRRHMHQYGTTEEQFGALRRRAAGVRRDEPRGHLPRSRSRSTTTWPSRYISKPLHLLDCDYPVDSGSALIFTTEERARDMAKKPVFFDAWAMGTTDALDFHLARGHDPVVALAGGPADVGPHRPHGRRTSTWPACTTGSRSSPCSGWRRSASAAKGESGPFVAAGNTRRRREPSRPTPTAGPATWAAATAPTSSSR